MTKSISIWNPTIGRTSEVTHDNLPEELVEALEDACVDFDIDTIKIIIEPEGSTYKIANKILILIPYEGFDYGDMVYYHDRINLKDLAGWNVLNGPGIELVEKIDSSKPAWLIYQYTGDSSWHIFQF